MRKYTPRGSTRNHRCHGCGVVKLKPTHGLCQDCRAALDWAVAERKRIEAMRGVVVRRLPKAAHALPYVNLDPIGHSSATSELQDRLRAVVWQVLNALELAYGGAGRILKDRERHDAYHEPPIPAHAEFSWGTDARFVAIPPETATALADFLPCVQEIAKAAAEAAYAEGRDLLGGLANGSLTADALAREDAEHASRLQRTKIKLRT